MRQAVIRTDVVIVCIGHDQVQHIAVILYDPFGSPLVPEV